MSILSQQKQSVNTDFPNIRPSLDLRFALAKKLDPRITFSRGSTGTYFGPDGLMRTAAANEPRFDHDPVTGQSLGLLIEESRQNLMTGSEDFSSTYWVPLNSVSVSTNVITAPDGTLTADKFRENTLGVSSHKVIARSFTLSASTTYTFSIFVKAAERTNIMIHLRKSDYSTRFGGFFNLTTKTFTSETAAGGTLVSSSIIALPNDWYRISVSGDIGANTAAVTTIYLCNTSNNISYPGDGNSGVYLWGAQLETGAFPTSYIPTGASTVTRSADTPNITNTTSFFNSTEGTLFVDSEIPYQTNLKFPAVGFARSGGGSSNTIQFFYYNTNIPYVQYLVRDLANGGGDLVTNSSPNQTVGSYKKFIGTYKVGEYNYYFDGKFVARRTTNKALPTNLTYMEIGTNAGTDNRLNGHIRRITYYPIQLTNQQLINLTS